MESRWYRNTLTVSDNTIRAIPALMTGGVVPLKELNIAASTFRTRTESLFTLLGASHDIDARETVTELCPPDLCDTDRDGAVVMEPRVLFLHVMLPHVP